jgi:pimeloyl-ACP methyl ester carboxylesterase
MGLVNRIRMTETRQSGVDFLEAGTVSPVILVHSSMAGAHQWSALMRELEGRFLVRAVNLFGYGGTPAWSRAEPPSLDDYAALVVRAVPPEARGVRLVGHSFGGAVAMRAAERLGARVESLVLVEPSLFYLSNTKGRQKAFSEIHALALRMKELAAVGAAERAAHQFIDYWAGQGAWTASSAQRQSIYTAFVRVVLHEWDAILVGDTTPEQWRERLPARTLIISSPNPMDPSRAVMQVLSDACSGWAVEHLSEGGHLAPITHPHVVNPVIAGFLQHG